MFESNKVSETVHEVSRSATDLGLFVVGGIASVLAYAYVRGSERMHHLPHPITSAHPQSLDNPHNYLSVLLSSNQINQDAVNHPQ